MKANQGFSDDILAVFRESKGLRIRAGTGQHRFIGIWFVVVNDRVFVRSWSVKPRGWYRTFLEEPRGNVQIADREIAVRAVTTRGKSVSQRPGSIGFMWRSRAAALKTLRRCREEGDGVRPG